MLAFKADVVSHQFPNDAESYRYLHESIRRFPSQRALAERMRKAGLANVAWRDMTLGVVALHSGWRI